MKQKFLLISLLLLVQIGVLSAQDTIRTLLITEARLDRTDQAYVEITNVGDKPIQLSNFKLGRLSAWTLPWSPGVNEFLMLPNKVLEPGKSYTIASVYDFIEKAHYIDPDNFGRNSSKAEWWKLADLQIHQGDANSQLIPSIKDSISSYRSVLDMWGGRDCLYLEQHLSDIDSVIIDQVGGVFDDTNGTNLDGGNYDVAGVTGATNTATLIRRFVVKKGNINFATARGVDITDSEWIPIPHLFANYELDRKVFWTVGNHGDYNLDENTLVSSVLEVDWAKKTITAPWGVRNNDDFMMKFQKKPGLAWHYHLSPAREDSAYMSARTGDKITIYACGNDLDVQTFDIVVAPPTADANMVLPKFSPDADGFYSTYINSGRNERFWVTENAPGMDSITVDFYGVPFATSVDTLMKYLEKAPKAKWEMVWVDKVARTAVKPGDKLKVTAENGAVKEYYIKVNGYRPSHVAYLSSITWPDIPEFYKGIFGWIGDTIPNFGPSAYNYKVQVPLEVNGIPALVAKSQQLNATVDVSRATNLNGTPEQKTVTFVVTAEDGTTQNTYSVQLEKERDPRDIQPYVAEPFLSEFVFRDNFANNFFEICNPGNQPLDLSNYMFYWGGASSPASAITSRAATTDWNNRYDKYIPGYKWVNESEWGVNPSRLVQDLSVNPIVLPGDVFVTADIINTGLSGYPWWASQQSDVIFQTGKNPWGQTTSKGAMWYNNKFHIFKILNDSVKLGLKPATDPNDFELIETFGMADGSRWNIAGALVNQVYTFQRKPEFYKGQPDYQASFGTNVNDCEWTVTKESDLRAKNIPWPYWRLDITRDIGKHFMNEITEYKSTVTSIVYKVSPGFSQKETVKGVKTGTTVAQFLNGIVKADEGQSLKVKSVANGNDLAMDALLSLNDYLLVTSADSTNTTKYILDVTQAGLSSNALLTSTRYKVNIVNEPKSATEKTPGKGTVTGFEYGTSLKTIVANITVPAGATMDIVNGSGAYVPLKTINFDTTYVNVTVNDNIYLDVTAEDGLTKIVYQLIPTVSEDDAFLTSDVYTVVQKDNLIQFVPRGTTAITLLGNVVPSAGASIKLVDRLGHERTSGVISQDDKIVVTSKNGKNSRVYYMSMLATQYILNTTYLAYIQSNTYMIDQVTYKISGVSGSATIADFYSKITASAGAVAKVVNKNGVEKTTGDIDGSDMVKVTSADGKMVVMYSFGPLTATSIVEAGNINLYPNPTNGKINISGVENGQRIQVYNSVGAIVRDIDVQRNIEVISLDKEPSGMFMIVISNDNKVIGRYKALKK